MIALELRKMTNNYKTDYLYQSLKRSRHQRREFNLNENINLYIKDPLTREVDVRAVMDKVSSSIPQHLISEIDSIFVGIFD